MTWVHCALACAVASKTVRTVKASEKLIDLKSRSLCVFMLVWSFLMKRKSHSPHKRFHLAPLCAGWEPRGRISRKPRRDKVRRCG
jgi:hypothetical protein